MTSQRFGISYVWCKMRKRAFTSRASERCPASRRTMGEHHSADGCIAHMSY